LAAVSAEALAGSGDGTDGLDEGASVAAAARAGRAPSRFSAGARLR
jgi:hypothetical protein